ncbi:Ig-like domain-containing protein [Parabacteroides sp. OttesenSCG-928-N08]|nr:Ig-like domain-containing protein [Parabacteroides sp. OttesenSCG-928-N08]
MKKNLFVVLFFALSFSTAAQTTETFRQWGEETIELINKHYRNSSHTYLYSEAINSHPAFAWPTGIMLKAIIYAGDKETATGYYREFHENYLCTAKGYTAYDAVYRNCGDRYYDDNAWIAKDLIDLYELTGDNLYLDRAKLIMKFCMSGKTAAGGIHFHENNNTPGHAEYGKSATCATAPVCATNLRIYRVTGEASYLEDAKGLYHYMRDIDGWGIGYGFRGYENAVVMQCALLMYQATGDEQYLDDTYQLAYSMETRYISWNSGRLNEIGKWGGHDMTDAYVYLYEEDNDPRWLHIAARYLTYLHDNCKDANGFYPEEWSDVSRNSRDRYFIEQASAAAAYMKMALTPGVEQLQKDPVAVYEHADYDGWSLPLSVGNYTKKDLEMRGMTTTRFLFDSSITSVSITDGYKVIFYSQDHFEGESIEFTSSSNYIGSWNDRPLSLKVIDLQAPALESIALEKESISMDVDQRLALTAIFTPSTAGNRHLTWSSGNPEVARVNKTGVVKALAVGETTITVTSQEGGFTASCRVKVATTGTLAAAVSELIESITLNDRFIQLQMNSRDAVRISLFDPSGRLVSDSNYPINGKQELTIPTNGLKGVCLLKASSSKESVVKKIVL